MLLTLTPAQLAAAGPRALSDALERGEIVHFAACPLELPSEGDLEFLRSGLSSHLRRKNVSWYYATDSLKGLGRAPEVAARAHALLAAHAARVRLFLSTAMPEFTAGYQPGTTSMRPLQERGRKLSAHASNELVHVDAGAYGATHGDRILRFFVNVHPSADRVWMTKGAFPALYRAHAEAAGLRTALGPPPVDDGPLDRAFTALVRGVSKVAPAAHLLDSSRYDRLMRRFHNWMKDTPAFQADKAGRQEIRFGPGVAWMVLTDQVSHACTEGQHALVDTFVVPLANCRLPALSPYQILRTGHAPAGQGA